MCALLRLFSDSSVSLALYNDNVQSFQFCYVDVLKYCNLHIKKCNCVEMWKEFKGKASLYV